MKDWLSTFFTNTLLFVCGVATGSLAAQLLLPEGRGALASVLFWPHLMAGIGCLSLNEAITYHTGQHTERAPLIRSTGFWIGLLLAVLTVVIITPLLPFLFGSERVSYVGLARFYLVIFIPLNFTGLNILAVDLGLLHMTKYNLTRLLQPLVYLGILLVLWMTTNASVKTIALANLLGVGTVAIVRIFSCKRELILTPAVKEAVLLLKTAAKFHAINLLFFLSSQIDQLLVITIMDNINVGYYVIGLSVSSACFSIVMQTFQNILFPKISQQNDDKFIKEYLAKSLRFAMLLFFAGTIILMVAMPWIIPVLFSKAFAPAILPAEILLLAYFPKAMRSVMSYSLRGMGVVKPQIMTEAIVILIFLVLFWPTLHFFGLSGVGIAMGIANLLALGYFAHFLKLKLKISIGDWWGINPETVRDFIGEGKRIFFSKGL